MLKLLILGSAFMGVLVLARGIKTKQLLKIRKNEGYDPSVCRDVMGGQLPTAAPPADWLFNLWPLGLLLQQLL